MHLEHINIVVKDLKNTLAFYQAAFPHWKVRGKGEQNWFGTQRQWLHFGDDYQYISFNDNGYGENRNLDSNQLGLCHFGYITNNLKALVERLAAAGFQLAKEGEALAHRQNVYYIDPDGYEIEFIQYFSDNPNERNNY